MRRPYTGTLRGVVVTSTPLLFYCRTQFMLCHLSNLLLCSSLQAGGGPLSDFLVGEIGEYRPLGRVNLSHK